MKLFKKENHKSSFTSLESMKLSDEQLQKIQGGGLGDVIRDTVEAIVDEVENAIDAIKEWW